MLVFFFGFALNYAKAGIILQHPNYMQTNSGLVGHWTFDGKDMSGNTAYDKTSNGNNGTLTGANGLPVRAIGKLGQALNFDGTDDYVDMNALANVPGAGTFCAWVYNESIPNAAEAIILSDESSAGTDYQYNFEVENDRTVGLFWNNDGGQSESFVSTTAISDNIWTRICAVRISGASGKNLFQWNWTASHDNQWHYSSCFHWWLNKNWPAR